MKRALLLLIAAWQIEMAVQSAVEASRRPAKPAVVDVTPTPTPSRDQKCEGDACKTPQPQSYRTTR